jgi:hypothetical protein
MINSLETSNKNTKHSIYNKYEKTTSNIEYPDISWSKCIEKDVKDIGEKSKGYKIMHIQESRKMSTRYKRLMYAGIFLGPIAGLLSGIGATLNPDEHVTFPIISGCVAFISGIVVAVTKYGKFEEKGSHHKIAASKYTGLESNVRRQLVLCRTDRINAVKYLEYIGSNFDELFLASPLVSKCIYDDYVIVAKNNGIIIPDEYGITINIDTVYQEEKFNEIRNFSNINVNRTSYSKEIKPEVPVNSGPKIYTPRSSLKTQGSSERLSSDKEIKRTGSVILFPELNKYSDGRMEYEMKRMTGLL